MQYSFELGHQLRNVRCVQGSRRVGIVQIQQVHVRSRTVLNTNEYSITAQGA